jgi:hypothetical protein
MKKKMKKRVNRCNRMNWMLDNSLDAYYPMHTFLDSLIEFITIITIVSLNISENIRHLRS